MSDAEASGYLLIAGGLIWIAVGIRTGNLMRNL